MATELEVTVLDIDAVSMIKQLRNAGAKKTQSTRLVVDWYRPAGIKEGEDPWYLRIRSYDGKKHEVTWKAKSSIEGVARKHKEINFLIAEPGKLADLFEELGLEQYAHQEKDRVSFSLGDIAFDFDTYPNMPTYVEIEGSTEAKLQKAMKLFGVENNRTWNQGERKLIQQIYGLDWYNMRF